MGIIESIGRRIVIRFGILFVLVFAVGALGGCGIGGIGLLTSRKKPDELVTLTAADYYKSPPQSRYLELKEVRLKMSAMFWMEVNGQIGTVYIPMLPKDDRNEKPLLILKSRDPEFIAAAKKSSSIKDGNSSGNFELITTMVKFAVARDFKGTTSPPYLVGEEVEKELKAMNPGQKVLLFNEGKAPLSSQDNLKISLIFLGIGFICFNLLGVALVILIKAFKYKG